MPAYARLHAAPAPELLLCQARSLGSTRGADLVATSDLLQNELHNSGGLARPGRPVYEHQILPSQRLADSGHLSCTRSLSMAAAKSRARIVQGCSGSGGCSMVALCTHALRCKQH